MKEKARKLTCVLLFKENQFGSEIIFETISVCVAR